jgi:2-iminobutanoate/2-iminopropanoate deaminase
MRKQVIAERGAPPKGIYSPAIVASGTIAYISGQGPIDPETGEFQLGSFAQQAKLTFDNVTKLLKAASTSWKHVVKVGVFLANLEDFVSMNDIYKTYLMEPYPARTTVQAGLPTDMLIEVDCMAIVPQES